MNHAFLIIGGNLGDRPKNLRTATALIEKSAGEIKNLSSVYETEPWGVEGQPDYQNQVIEILTPLDAETLMKTLLQVEQQMGRERTEKYGSRIIDIDILFYNDAIINKENLTIPHPRLHERRFVLEPMAEIARDFIHPVLQKNIEQLLAVTKDNSIVKLIKPSLQ